MTILEFLMILLVGFSAMALAFVFGYSRGVTEGYANGFDDGAEYLEIITAIEKLEPRRREENDRCRDY